MNKTTLLHIDSVVKGYDGAIMYGGDYGALAYLSSLISQVRFALHASKRVQVHRGSINKT